MKTFRGLKLIDTILSSYIHRYITSLALSLQSNKSKNLKTTSMILIFFTNLIYAQNIEFYKPSFDCDKTLNEVE